jgi:CBS domain-containing protein
MRPISTILKGKSHHAVFSIAPDASVFEALQIMARENVGALLVMEHDKLVGILSERDYARKIALHDLSSRLTPVRQIMSSPVLFVTPHQTSQQCMAMMTSNRLRHLPVMEEGKLLGMVSIGDLVKDIISELEFSNDQLVHYINGDHGAISYVQQRLI